MADRDYTPDEMRLVELYHQLIALSDDKTVAGRFILLGPDGAIIANGSLAARDIEAATLALAALNEAKAATEESTGHAVYAALPKVPIDQDLENELEKYCIGLDTDHLFGLAAQDQAAAVAEFDQITSDVEGDGTL
jgi:hypothetical protein